MQSTQTDQELEQEEIKKLLFVNVEQRNLEDEFAEFYQELQETSQIDLTEYGLKQMKQWLCIFLQERNLQLINISGDQSPSTQSNSEQVSDTLIPQPVSQFSSINKIPSSDQPNNNNNNINNNPNNYPPIPTNPPQTNTQGQQNLQADESMFDIQDFNPTGQQPKQDFFDSDDDFDDIPFPSPQEIQQQQKEQQRQFDLLQKQKQEQEKALKEKEQQQQQQQFQGGSYQGNQMKQEEHQYPQSYSHNNAIDQHIPQQNNQYQTINNNNNNKNNIPDQKIHPRSFTEGEDDKEYLEANNNNNNKGNLNQTDNQKRSHQSFGPTTNNTNQQPPATINNSGNKYPNLYGQQQQQIEQQKQQEIEKQKQIQIQQQIMQQQLQQNQNQKNIQNQQQQKNDYPQQSLDMTQMPEFKNPLQGMMNLTQQFNDISIINKEEQPSQFFISAEEQIKLIEQFEKQLQDREQLNTSQVVDCQKVELNKIGKFLKQYPDKKPRVTIQSYRILEEGFLKQNYVLYTVSLSELGWTCYRRYSDFKTLRDIFENQYPGYFIPPLPRRNMRRKFEPEYLEKRMKILEQFMEAVLESELLRNSSYIEDFLFIQDEVKYRKVASSVKEGPQELNQFYSVDGKINCQNSTNFQTYGAAFRNYTQNLTTLYEKAKILTKEVVKNLDDSQKSLKSLSSVFSDLSKTTNEFNQRNKIGVNTYLQRQYEENSKFLNEYSDFLEKQQKLFKNYIYLKMRYEKKVCEVFEEMSNKRNRLMATFQEAFTKLGQKRQRLFDKKDTKQWDLPPNLPVDQLTLIQTDQKLAFKYMLPRETMIVKQMNKKINFFNSNLFYETRKYLKIRETKISNDFIMFTQENGEHLTKLKEYHDQHLQRLNQIVLDSQQNLIQQIDDDKKIIDQSINGTFLTDAQCQIRKAQN